jgi:hypothetical protein
VPLTNDTPRYTEAQAIDRAYRIGQMRPVQVHRLLVPDTVEDRILALQEKKKELIETALDENAARNMSRLGVRELGYLFVGWSLRTICRLLILSLGCQCFVTAF